MFSLRKLLGIKGCIVDCNTGTLTEYTKVRWTASQIVDMIETWVEVNAADVRAAEERKTDGTRPYTMRARAATLIVPEEAFAPEARGKIYDTAEWYRAAPAERTAAMIKLVDVNQERQHHWNVKLLREWADKSACPDRKGVQELSERGIAPDFTGKYSIVLVPNAKSFLADITEGQRVEQSEVEEGLISVPVRGLPMIPIKVHPMSIALQWRGNKLKKRVVGDMTAPHNSGTEEEQHGSETMADHAPNAGFDINGGAVNEWPELEYPSSAQFAGDMACVFEACRDVPEDYVLMKADWKRYYRQGLRAIWLCWLQGSMSSAGGVSVDYRLVFGDASNPSSMNWVQDILMWIARWLLCQAWGIDDTAPDTWASTVLRQSWAKAGVRAWMVRRWAEMGEPKNGATRLENMELLFQAIPMALAAFFDDAMFGGLRQVCLQFEQALMRICTELGVEASLEKFTSADTATTVRHRISTTEWSTPESGHPDILGKEFDLTKRVRRDVPIRIRSTTALLTMIQEQAQQSGRMVATTALRRVRGQVNFITDQHPQHRCFTQGITAAVTRDTSTEPAWQRGAQRAQRAATMAEHAYRRGAGEYDSDTTQISGRQHGLDTMELGPSTFLERKADGEIAALIDAMSYYNEEAFLPRRSPPSTDAVFILQDSAGLMRDDDQQEVQPQPGRAGACWFYSQAWKSIPWCREQWEEGVLRVASSTVEEAATGNANLIFACNEWPGRSEYIEIYDSKTTTQIWSRGASKAPAMRTIVKERREFLEARPDVRVRSIWQAREKGTPADMLSKYDDHGARAALLARFPHQPMEAAPRPRRANVINRTWRAAHVMASKILGVPHRPDWAAELP